jgi:hypothetical protein
MVLEHSWHLKHLSKTPQMGNCATMETSYSEYKLVLHYLPICYLHICPLGQGRLPDVVRSDNGS